MALAIRNIGELVMVPKGPVPGRSMRNVPRLACAAVLIEGGRIAWFGPDAELSPPSGCEILDAAGGCVVPGLVDCHTHTVFDGTREAEFVRRIEVKRYAEIAREGGGIRVTVEAVRRASRDDLVELARPRLGRMLQNGVTTVEIKSGYGLTVDDEVKMLEAVRRLGELQPVELVATYLAAHTVPPEFEGRPDAYLDAVMSDEVLSLLTGGRAGAKSLKPASPAGAARLKSASPVAEFCDVFCETTAFNVEQSRRVLQQGKRFGLLPKLHADQITQIGASALAGEVGAISADHLEKIDDAGISALKSTGSIAVLLPACSFFLGVEQAPARRLLDADLPVAVATDFNPGSSMVESLPLTLSIAATQMLMTPDELLIAATANAAAAINRHNRLGAIALGMQADLVILDVPNLNRWIYEPGRNCVRSVIKSGKIVHRTP